MTLAISGLGAQSVFDRQTFGAAVVSETLDTMNGRGSSLLPVDKASAEGALVSKTLDYMNPGSMAGNQSGMNQTYDLSKNVLGAYAGTGSILDTMI
jgi:hypothetical protein